MVSAIDKNVCCCVCACLLRGVACEEGGEHVRHVGAGDHVAVRHHRVHRGAAVLRRVTGQVLWVPAVDSSAVSYRYANICYLVLSSAV